MSTSINVPIYLLCIFLFCSCASSQKSKEVRSHSSVSVKYVDVPLEKVDAGGWIGGTRKYPLCLTAEGARILTPMKGLVSPNMKRSIDLKGRVVYPFMGYQLVGDVKVSHFRALISALSGSKVIVPEDRPVKVFVDSNRLHDGALVHSSKGDKIAEFLYKEPHWVLKR